MGKTYVALAVASSYILRSAKNEQVVVFVPPRVAPKWVEEWKKFSESLLHEGHGIRCVDTPIRSGEDFLRALDDAPSRRNHVVILTHSALTANLQDAFIQLALMWYATRKRWGAGYRRAQIARWSNGRRGLLRDRRFTTETVDQLMQSSPEQWRAEWTRITGQDLADDPVPAQLHLVMSDINLDGIWEVIQDLPHRASANTDERLKVARKTLNQVTQEVWRRVLAQAKPRMPLIIVDEAHALKNDATNISRLFSPRSDHPSDGALAGIFERMLLLTATPFELGHDELIRVLSRLNAIRPMRPKPAEPLVDRLDRLKMTLRRAQETAITLERSWARLVEDDCIPFDQWSLDGEPNGECRAEVRQAWRDAGSAVRARRELFKELQPWVIRHERDQRREYFEGNAIRLSADKGGGGLVIPDSAALPFLLAARAQAVAADERSGAARPLFAYGIASSYEAYLRLESGEGVLDADTDHEGVESNTDVDEDPGRAHVHSGSSAGWYSREIAAMLGSAEIRAAHPKIDATVERAVALWESGQKCLIFCWYIRTTAALRDALNKRIDDVVEARASRALGVSAEETSRELERIADRLLRTGSANHSRIRAHIKDRFQDGTAGDVELANSLAEVAIRCLRTPGYLVRYTRLGPRFGVDELLSGIDGDNPAHVDLVTRWSGYAGRVASMTPAERASILHHLLGEDKSASGRGASLQQVRRAYGQTGREDRERLIRVFNTPFAPDILVASSVMGEGIDLHQECRHVIHHDLDWNPSKLEQRTGRLDRIGALAERENTKIAVYEPFLAGTHDEKMFRVVKDRAGWFGIVMGSAVREDEIFTDAVESRIRLHPRIAGALRMDLSSPNGD